MKTLSFLILLPLCIAQCAAAGTGGFSVSALDRAVDPCTDFYRFACGSWLAQNPVPADQSTWGRFHELAERNRVILRGILEKAAEPSAARTADEAKLGDYYASCMDEKAAENLGYAPLKGYLADIAAIKDADGVSKEIVRLYADGISSFFRFGSTQDYKDATRYIAEADQGGLGLPEKDYYLRTDAASAEMRAKYAAHVRNLFALTGYSAEASSAAAVSVLRFETGLAKVSMGKVDRRDPARTYHKITVAELRALVPGLDWDAFFAAAGAPVIKELNAASYDYLKNAGAMLGTVPVESWKTYLAWRVINSRASLLSKAFVDEDFDFYGRTLRGAKELRPRWKRCADQADAGLGDLLGKGFVAAAFSPAAKTAAIEMVRNIEGAMSADITGQPWMAEKTKGLGQVKLSAIENKMGYPDKWRDYSGLAVVRSDWFGNNMRADVFDNRRQLDKINRPADRTDWDMSAPTVNAYYDPGMNTINFPAGILQPPFFDAALDPAVNYGGIGGVIGHELTHGFDDQGRKFDAKGNMNDWWTEADGKEFEQKSECFVNEYSSFTVAGGLPVNGKLTLGENTADNGGLRLALMALNGDLVKKPAEPIDGFSQTQRLFLGWAQVWCTNYTDASLRLQVQTDPHSPAETRVNGVVRNMPEFAAAYGCSKGKPMAPEAPCRLW